MSERVCGGCTACCKTHPVLSINKPIGKWCWHCTIGKGCKIYTERPSGCAEFKCQWLMGYGNDNNRPDRSKIVIDFYRLEVINEKTVSLWEMSEGALDRQLAEDVTIEMLQDNIPVLHIHLGGRRLTLYLPPNRVLTEEQIQIFAESSIELAGYTFLRI